MLLQNYFHSICCATKVSGLGGNIAHPLFAIHNIKVTIVIHAGKKNYNFYPQSSCNLPFQNYIWKYSISALLSIFNRSIQNSIWKSRISCLKATVQWLAKKLDFLSLSSINHTFSQSLITT